MPSKLAIVVPAAAGRVQNLRFVFESLAHQTDKDGIGIADRFDVVLVNDGQHADIRVFALMAATMFEFAYLDLPKYVAMLPGRVMANNWQGRPPRNVGASVFPDASHYLFVDSDVVLDRYVIATYLDDLERYPDDLIAGPYAWLPPMQCSPQMIFKDQESLARFFEANYPKLPFPEGEQTHNVAPDFRADRFASSTVKDVFVDDQSALACFGGNLLVPREIFEKVDGFASYLSAGLVDDGDFGLRCLRAGARFRFDARCRGAHLYHPRNLEYVQKQSAIEVKIFKEKLGLDQSVSFGAEERGDGQPAGEKGIRTDQ